MATRRQPMASDHAGILRANTAALEAHTAALIKNTEALLTHQTAAPEGIGGMNLFSANVDLARRSNKTSTIADLSTMTFGDVYHESDCIDGLKEVWSSDGRGGLRKDYCKCPKN